MKFYSLSSLIAGLGCFFFATVVLLKGRKNNQNRSFFMATVLTGIWTLFPFLASLPERDDIALFIARLLYLFASFVPTAWFYFMINVLGSSERERIKLFTFYFISILFASFSFTRFLIKGITRFAPYFCPQAGTMYFLFIIFFAGVFIYILCTLFTALKNARGYYRRQLTYVSWAYFIGAMSGVIHFIAAYTNKEPFPHDLLLIIYPLILAYAVVKHRLMDISVTITRTGIFIAVYTLVLGLPFVLFNIYRIWFIKLLGVKYWIGPLILMAVFATSGTFFYIYLQKRAEALLLREQHRYQEALKQAARELARIHNLKRLLNLIVHIVTKTVHLSHSAIYLYDEKCREFVLKASRNFRRNPTSSIAKIDPLVLWLERHKEPLVYEEINLKVAQGNADILLKDLEEQMHRLGASVIVPGLLKDNLMGFLILGDKLSGGIYTLEDLNIFSVLASEAALAIENALLYENIEEQVKQRTEELVEVQRQLIHAEKLATVGTLAGGVAHEINNPLTAILTNVQMLLSIDNPMDADSRESLELIEEATKRCRTIVQKLMTYARKPLQPTEMKTVDLLKIARDVVSFIAYQLEQENIKVMIKAGEEDYLVTGNQNELEQLLTNILLNAKDAIKQLKKDGRIDIQFSKIREKIKVEIRDDGIGIPGQIISKIFDPFFTTKDVGKGVGLGLSICQGIVEKHHGMISVQSEVNKGAVFTIHLPRISG